MSARTIKISYWILTIIFALFMVFSGVVELMQTESAQKGIVDLGYPVYFNYIIGVAKLLGVVAILQSRFKTIKEWAYAGFTFDIVGAGASLLLVGGGIMSLLFVVPFLAVLFGSYVLWKKLEEV
jgi:hypothetical protein